MAAYDAAVADEHSGKNKAISAVIAYGKALLAGRNEDGKRRSNIDFSRWVSDNKLDVGKPWEHRNERAAAMKIAEVVARTVLAKEFNDCPNARPMDIMKWYRRTHPESAKTKQPSNRRSKNKSHQHFAEADVVTLFDKGGLTQAEIASQTGVSLRQVRHIIEREQTRRDAVEQAMPNIDATTLSMSAQKKLETAMRVMERKLNAEHAVRMAQIEEEIRLRVIAENKEYLAMVKEREKEANKTVALYQEWTNNLKPIFTQAEFNIILKSLDSSAIAFRLKEPESEHVKQMDADMIKRMDKAMTLVRDMRDRLTLKGKA